MHPVTYNSSVTHITSGREDMKEKNSDGIAKLFSLLDIALVLAAFAVQALCIVLTVPLILSALIALFTGGYADSFARIFSAILLILLALAVDYIVSRESKTGAKKGGGA